MVKINVINFPKFRTLFVLKQKITWDRETFNQITQSLNMLFMYDLSLNQSKKKMCFLVKP